jgi:predicted ATP-grasp superfamily ATP-dependent carboligase
MSATFVANGSDAKVLGFNQLIVRPLSGRPFVFCGAVGPVPLASAVAARVTAAVRAIAAGFSLRGLGSLDFMLDGDKVEVLEVNPRPPASMALYARRGGVVAAHVRACIQGVLPRWPMWAAGDPVHGTEFVFAPRPLRLDEAGARRLATLGDCHDLPAFATTFDVGDPLCSVSADGADPDGVREMLARGREAVYRSLEDYA